MVKKKGRLKTKIKKRKIEKQEIICGIFIDSNNKCGHNIFKLYWKQGYIRIGLVEKIKDVNVVAECQKCKGYLPIITDINIRTEIRYGHGGKVEYKKDLKNSPLKMS